MSHDTLSDVLRCVRLRSAVFYYVGCEGAWVAEAPASREIAGAVLPGVEHVFEYHAVTAGECWAAIVGEQPRRVHRGDVILLPHGDPHVMSSAPGMRADPLVDSYFEAKSAQRPFRVRYVGGAGPQFSSASVAGAPPASDCTTMLVCGFIGCDLRPFNPLIATLPRLMHLPSDGGTAWSERFVHLAAVESAAKRPGSEALLERMSEMMFVDAIRRHVDALPEESKGWLAGLRDRFVGRALAMLHEEPAAAWSLEQLGSRVGLSRSALHERFVELVGQPPMHYLAQWRMQLASRLLLDTQSSVAAVAARVGYDSEAAFARAFKRAVGTPPAAWRRMKSEPRAAPAAHS
jgi:AraC-like DNA-binding protein